MAPADAKENEHGGWINISICEELVSKPLNFVCAIDGSDPSMLGFKFVTEGVMQQNRETFCELLHVWDPDKDYLPPSWRPDALKTVAEATLAGAVSQKRYRINWVRKEGKSAAYHITQRTKAIKADFTCLGFTGRKGKKDKNIIASNVQEALSMVAGGVIVIKDESPDVLPIKRSVKYVVSVSLNKASTKAFLDALRLSQPGDEIHVVYVKGFMERTDSDYTALLREKYTGFFSGLQDGVGSSAFSKFQDRKTEFVMVSKQRRETTAQAVVRYGDDIEADFMVVGTNQLRVQKGKTALGSVSLDICMEWERNFIVSHWIDIDAKLYDEYGSKAGKTLPNMDFGQ